MTQGMVFNRNFTLFIFFFVSILLFNSCSTRPYRMKRAKHLYRQGQIYLSKANHEKAMAKFQESLAMSEVIDFKPGIAHNLNEMAIIHTSKGGYAEAKRLLDRSIAIYTELNMKPEVSKTMNNIASIYVRKHNFEEAINQFERLIEWDKHYDNDLGVAITLNNMGLLYQNHLRQHGEAKKKYTEALEILRRLGKEKYIQMVEKNLATY